MKRDGIVLGNNLEHILLEMQEELFSSRGEGWFRVVSGSMHPLVNIHDRIFAKYVYPKDIAVGDVVVFRESGVFVTHRVVEIFRNETKTMILQKGDASSIATPIDINSVIGKVTALEKNGKVVRLDQGVACIVNKCLAFKSAFHYRLRNWALHFRNKAGFQSLKICYRTFQKITEHFNHKLIRWLLG